MKTRFILKVLVGCILLLVLSACSRRNHYEDILESKQESESLAALPETNEPGGNITGENAPDYETPTILKTGNAPFYEGKTMEDLQKIYRSTGKTDFYTDVILPSGRLYKNQHFYNKLTGNFSNWCSDPLCDGKDCIWNDVSLLQYISENHIYFMAANSSRDSYAIYRCDLNRNNIEKVADVASSKEQIDENSYWITIDEIQVVYEKDHCVYYRQTNYDKQKSIKSLYVLDMNTGESRLLSGDAAIELLWIVNDTVFYSVTENYYGILKTDLNFSKSEPFWENASIDQYNDQYLIIQLYENYIPTTTRYVYNLYTGKTIQLDVRGTVFLSGDYVYYTRHLTEEEIANDSQKDYYTFTWEESDGLPGSVPFEMDAGTKGAGKVYRLRLDQDNAPEETVFQMTYKGVPIRIESFEMDGEVMYFTFHNYEGFKNFYNQDFDENESETCYYGMVDFHNGTVTILEFPEEG